MPELPEVETVKQALVPALQNRKILSAYVGRKSLRWSLPCDLSNRLKNRHFINISRRGKYILMSLDNNEILLMHLGMSGSVRIHKRKPAIGKHDHFMLEMSSLHGDEGQNFVVLNDPRRFGWIDLFTESLLTTHKLLARMGPEPLGNDFSATYLEAAFKGRSGAVKNALLDQTIVAGIGNIYANEALFLAGISPRRKAGSIAGVRAERLASAIVTTLRTAIDDGGTSLRDHVQPGVEIGYFAQRLAVYGRTDKVCTKCNALIKTIIQSGRSSFYCSQCQR